MLTFQVMAHGDVEQVAQGNHRRVQVQTTRLVQKAITKQTTSSHRTRSGRWQIAGYLYRAEADGVLGYS
ncbi:hypothetical protein RY27_11755 [Litorilinea aerophila]|nr:hypothetical protein RY27_11755 [Litorilinea aerophila]